MNKRIDFQAADLFCGAGGTSRGLAQACEEMGVSRIRLIAVNHWTIAIENHRKNHPWAEHICESLEKVDPRKVVPGGRLNILVASPECTNHSVARGGRPVNDQSRSTAWGILKWLQELYVENILIENVGEFRQWGPIGADGQPLKSKRGETYKAFLNAIRSLGYRVEDRILNAADYGDATTRQRLFIMGKRTPKKITWPMPSHTKFPEKVDLYLGKLKAWRPAREIIDWSVPGESIFARKKPLAPSTIDRIAAGIRRFSGPYADPFLVMLYGTGKANSVHRPVPTVTATGQHIAICEPFILSHHVHKRVCVDSINDPMRTIVANARDAKIVQPFIITPGGPDLPGGRSVEDPLPTVVCKDRMGLATPFLIPYYGERRGQGPRTHDVGEPVPVIPASGGGKFALVNPFLLGIDHASGTGSPRSVNSPVPTICTKESIGIVQPFIISAGGPEGQGRNPGSVEDPLGTVMGQDHKALVRPFIVPLNHGPTDQRTYDVDNPMPTVTAFDAWALIKPFLVKYYGTKQRPKSVDDPLETVTGKDRFGLVDPMVGQVPEGMVVDILFRMLRTEELAAAMSFDKTYLFVGTREQKVKLVGNAVPVMLAKALCKALLSA